MISELESICAENPSKKWKNGDEGGNVTGARKDATAVVKPVARAVENAISAVLKGAWWKTKAKVLCDTIFGGWIWSNDVAQEINE